MYTALPCWPSTTQQQHTAAAAAAALAACRRTCCLPSCSPLPPCTPLPAQHMQQRMAVAWHGDWLDCCFGLITFPRWICWFGLLCPSYLYMYYPQPLPSFSPHALYLTLALLYALPWPCPASCLPALACHLPATTHPPIYCPLTVMMMMPLWWWFRLIDPIGNCNWWRQCVVVMCVCVCDVFCYLLLTWALLLIWPQAVVLLLLLLCVVVCVCTEWWPYCGQWRPPIIKYY